MLRLLSAGALALAVATVSAVADRDGIRASSFGLGAATVAALAGAVIADRATMRRLGRR